MKRLVTVLLFLLGACGDDVASMPMADGAAVCASADDCDDGLFCNGDEVCDPGSAFASAQGCRAGTPPCADSCDEVADACVEVCQDADGDGHPDVACGGDDCDDTDPDRYPGNAEICDDDGHDEDCDPTTLGGDPDGDGYVGISCCNGERCGTDCGPMDPAVRPDTVDPCGEGDQDCDGTDLPCFTEAIFTTCGQDGRTGPSQSQCDNAYAGTAELAGNVTVSMK